MRAFLALPVLALLGLWLIAGSTGYESRPGPALSGPAGDAEFADRIGLGRSVPGSVTTGAFSAGVEPARLAEASGGQPSSARSNGGGGADIWSAPAQFAPPDPIP